ncbi:kinase-like domain-containing protein [Mycena olivaceomarginata]|nr:kinase-like domain-containing protein [Mycena olivaceomarginata]
MTTLFNIALEKILVYVTLNIKPALVAATNVFSWLTVPQQSIRESRVYHNAWGAGSAQIDWPVTTVASATPRTGDWHPLHLSPPHCLKVLAQSISTSIQNRGQYHRNTWKDAANINESGIRVQNSTVPITGTSIATLRSNNLASNECLVFILEPFVGTKPCTYLSTFEVIREGTIKFCEIVDNGITSFNSSWEQDSEESLTRMNNVHIEIEPQALFKDVLQTVLKDSGQLLNKTAPNKFRNRKFPTVYIEAHIELAKFEDCTGVSPPRALFKVLKRARTDTLSSSQGGSVLKRSCLANTARSLKSSFALHAPATNATASSDATTGIQSFTWPTEAIISSEVMIDNIPSNKGKSKFVFKVIYNELPYVAKRCYTLGNGTPVSIIANRNELIKEATTLGRAKFFLANFKDEYFEVTDFIIAVRVSEYEALTDGEKDELVINDDLVSSVTWLLERERGNVDFRKYSGTLEHPRHTDKQGATINAFQHFTYLNSNKSLLLADIQSSESHDPSTKASILFDLMSHTLSGDSGAGDHGDDGIQTFVDQHECGQRCKQLGLEQLVQPEVDND